MNLPEYYRDIEFIASIDRKKYRGHYEPQFNDENHGWFASGEYLLFHPNRILSWEYYRKKF